MRMDQKIAPVTGREHDFLSVEVKCHHYSPAGCKMGDFIFSVPHTCIPDLALAVRVSKDRHVPSWARHGSHSPHYPSGRQVSRGETGPTVRGEKALYL